MGIEIYYKMVSIIAGVIDCSSLLEMYHSITFLCDIEFVLGFFLVVFFQNWDSLI